MLGYIRKIAVYPCIYRNICILLLWKYYDNSTWIIYIFIIDIAKIHDSRYYNSMKILWVRNRGMAIHTGNKKASDIYQALSKLSEREIKWACFYYNNFIWYNIGGYRTSCLPLIRQVVFFIQLMKNIYQKRSHQMIRPFKIN